MDSIVQAIRDATICLADITTDNPNVWYELGYAFAAGRSVVMVCSGEREDKLPFDIQHQTVIMYEPESESDFVELRETISTRAKALVKKNAVREVVEAQQIAPTDGLSQAELSVLAIAAAETAVPGNPVSALSLRNDAMRAGLTVSVLESRSVVLNESVSWISSSTRVMMASTMSSMSPIMRGPGLTATTRYSPCSGQKITSPNLPKTISHSNLDYS